MFLFLFFKGSKEVCGKITEEKSDFQKKEKKSKAAFAHRIVSLAYPQVSVKCNLETSDKERGVKLSYFPAPPPELASLEKKPKMQLMD